MAKSNWKGSSGWGAIDDPTNFLSGRVLVVSAGATQTTEDYLEQIVGTSTEFNIAHYCVKMDYAFTPTSYQFEAGTLGLIARASNYSGGSPSTAQDAYIASFSNKDSSVDIIRRKNNVDSTIATAGLPPNISSTSQKHEIKFKCYGTSPTTLQLYIDDEIAINIGDNTTSELTSGDAGIHVQGGTVYADNFAVIEYTSTGQEPALWDPSSVTTPSNLSIWLRSDSGVSLTGSNVSSWTDKGSNSNNATNSLGSGPTVLSAALNGYDTLLFNGTNQYLGALDSASLDLNSSGVSFVFMIKLTKTSASSQGLVTKEATYLSSAESTGTLGGLALSDGSSTDSSTLENTFFNNWRICVINKSDKFYVNGSEKGATTVVPAADNSNGVVIGAKNISSSFTDFFGGEIAEIIVHAGQISTGDRQKLEGYMAHRYGVQSNLPSTHPYRNFAPTV